MSKDFRGVQYHVDEAQGIVVAFIENREDDVIEMLQSELEKEKLIGYQYHRKYKLPRKFVARATCHAPDVFNEEYGKELARLKVEEQYSSAVAKRLWMFKEHLCRDICGRVDKRIDTAVNAAELCEEQKIAMMNFIGES
jgi:hypothetical protein